MPTPYSSIAAVAQALAGVDPRSDRDVELFYSDTILKYSPKNREIIFDWLASTVENPSAYDLKDLAMVVNSYSDAQDEGNKKTQLPLADRMQSNKTVATFRKRVLEGVVVSKHNIDQTVVVKVERRFTHPVMKKTVRRSKHYHAFDEESVAKLGQTVFIEESRPFSKTKSWKLIADLPADTKPINTKINK